MKLHELHPAEGSTAYSKRLGRGSGSGLGKTSGKGHKGAKARSGGGKRPGRLEAFEDGAVVDAKALLEARIIRKELDGVKILGGGELTKKLTVKAAKFTASAKEKIEAVGGKAEVI